MRKLLIALALITLSLAVSGYRVNRYFVPFVFLDTIDFDQQKQYHEKYYELHEVSDTMQIEYVKLTANDSVITTYYYPIIKDTAWLIPINKAIDSLCNELDNEKDKQRRKVLQRKIEWYGERYF